MPQPSRPCPTPRCAELQPCSRHERKPFATARRSTALYRTARWRRESKAFLAANPWCVASVEMARSGGDRTTRRCAAAATIADHHVPHRGDEAKFWDEGNWAALCRQHHNAKTGRETRVRADG